MRYNVIQVQLKNLLAEPTRNGLTKPKAIRGNGVPMIGMGEVFANNRIFSFPMERVPVTDKELSSSSIHEGDLLFARQSLVLEGAGKCCIVKEVNEPTVFESHLIRVRLDNSKALADYIYYYFKSFQGKENIMTIVEQVAAAGIRGSDLVNLYIPVPPITVQQQIVQVLMNIDDKIAVNTAINENLEQQAQAIFKSWFVDFEPFGGIMPDDWRMGTLSEIAEINSGKRPPMRQADKTDNVYVPLVGAASVMGYTNESNHSDKILVIGRVGTHGIVQRFNIPCWTSDNTLVLTSPYYEYTYQVLKRIDYTAMNRGSTQPLITQGDMNKAEIFLPDEKYILKYESLVGTLFAQYEHNRAENENLAALRDTLLPKLMNGEIDVSEVNI